MLTEKVSLVGEQGVILPKIVSMGKLLKYLNALSLASPKNFVKLSALASQHFTYS